MFWKIYSCVYSKHIPFIISQYLNILAYILVEIVGEESQCFAETGLNPYAIEDLQLEKLNILCSHPTLKSISHLKHTKIQVIPCQTLNNHATSSYALKHVSARALPFIFRTILSPITQAHCPKGGVNQCVPPQSSSHWLRFNSQVCCCCPKSGEGFVCIWVW